MSTNALPPEWDDQLEQLGGSFLQSAAWSKFQESLGRPTIFDQGDGWMWLANIRQSRGLRYLLCSYGPAARDAAAMQLALASLVEAGKEHRVDFVRVEPQFYVTPLQLQQLGGVQIHEFQAQHTQIVDLTPGEEELRSALSSSGRNLINGTERRGITVRTTTQKADFEQFLLMLDDTSKRSGAKFFSRSIYEAMWDSLTPDGTMKLYLAEAEGGPVSAGLFYDWGTTRYYAHGGAFQRRNRKLRATNSMVWRALLDAKTAGMTKFDLWGIAPDGAVNHPWSGITEFKKSFGGQSVAYAGTWDIPLKARKYKLYGLYRSLRGRD